MWFMANLSFVKIFIFGLLVVAVAGPVWLRLQIWADTTLLSQAGSLSRLVGVQVAKPFKPSLASLLFRPLQPCRQALSFYYSFSVGPRVYCGTSRQFIENCHATACFIERLRDVGGEHCRAEIFIGEFIRLLSAHFPRKCLQCSHQICTSRPNSCGAAKWKMCKSLEKLCKRKKDAGERKKTLCV